MVGYVLFQSAQAAAWADSLLRRQGLPVRLVPTPRQLGSACGTALSFEAQDGLAALVDARLREGGVPFIAIRLLEAQSGQAQEGGRNGP